MTTRKRTSAVAIAALALLLADTPRPARAQAPQGVPEAQAKIKALNGEARAAFQSYSYRGAAKKLEAALDIAAEARLRQDPAVAETYLLLGITSVAGFNDLYRGLHYFVKAQRMDPALQIPKDLNTPQLQEMFGRSQGALKAVGQPPTLEVQLAAAAEEEGGEQPSEKVAGLGLIHEAIDSAKCGFPIPIKARAGIDVQAHKVFLYYRAAGKVQFQQLPMRRTQGAFRAAIPVDACVGRYIHYYIEAQDQRGRPNARHGSSRSPNVIILK